MNIILSFKEYFPKELQKLINDYLVGPLILLKIEYENRILSGIQKNFKLNGEYLLCYDFPNSSRPPLVMSEKKEDFAEFIWNF